jgi:hypothetical protein
MNRVVMIVLGVLAVLAIAAGSFYGGMVYGKNQAQADLPMIVDAEGMPTGQGQFATLPEGQRGMIRGQFAGGQGGMLFGEIQAIGNGELTVTDQNGEPIQVIVADTTLIQKQAEVTLADLEVGETVVVSGNRDDQGNITARSLQVSPGGGGFFGPPDNTTPGGE